MNIAKLTWSRVGESVESVGLPSIALLAARGQGLIKRRLAGLTRRGGRGR